MQSARKKPSYLEETRDWLNQRFDLFDADGNYVPNQPSYGFSTLAFRLEEYARTASILLALNQMDAASVLEVGCADGYLIGYLSRFWGVRTFGIDLSDRAIDKAKRMYGAIGVSADVSALPVCSDAVDVVIASETLEHVEDIELAVAELHRIARKFVIVTMPRARSLAEAEQCRQRIDPNEPHAHLHHLTDSEIRGLFGQNALYLGARNRYMAAFYNAIAWGDPLTLPQRKAYFDFTMSSTRIADSSREAVQFFLLGRYMNQANWKRHACAPSIIQNALLLDSMISQKCPFMCHDHLVISGKFGKPALRTTRSKPSRVVFDLLNSHQVHPLKVTT